MPHRTALIAGTLFALAAGLMWGLVFVVPLLLPQYPPLLLSFGRYLAFGLVALPLALWDWQRLRQLTSADWLEASKLAVVGNLVYYLFLASAIQVAGAPLPTMIIGTLPVVIAVCSNIRDKQRDGQLPWWQLLPCLLLMALGIALVNHAELQANALANAAAQKGLASQQAWGAALAVVALVCWTWYPLRNADWMRAHRGRSASTWATAQGVATLPLAAVGYGAYWVWQSLFTSAAAPGSEGLVSAITMPFGPAPERFIALMLGLGLLASWLGTLCWNAASQRLPTTLAGQLIIFETLSALVYAFVLRGHWPPLLTTGGVTLLVVGVMTALRLKPVPSAAIGPITH